MSDSSVYLSWRFLKDDPENATYNIYRQQIGVDTAYKKINPTPVYQTTDFVDKQVRAGFAYQYKIKLCTGHREQETGGTSMVFVSGNQPYYAIQLKNNTSPKRVAVGDLDGDGAYDYVIQYPDVNIDPYHRYWKRSADTYKLEAYNAKGHYLWRYDMGWGIETGTWYAPYTVFDIDEDGKAEVYTKAGAGDPREIDGHVLQGPEYLLELDGRSGKEIKKKNWLPKSPNNMYAHWNRNFLTVAFLDGKHPSLIMQRGGSYGSNMEVLAMTKNLDTLWRWASLGPYSKYKAQGGHKILSADVDGDGKDELIPGSFALDDNGVPLWYTGLKHSDVVHVADIDPSRPGLEIFYGIEAKSVKNGLCLVEAASGKIIWGYAQPTTHIHSNGLTADLDPAIPGMECYGGEHDGSKYFLYSARGTLINQQSIGHNLSPYSVWWDADDSKEIVSGKKIVKYPADSLMSIEGKVILVADVIGDWREEIITSCKGELRIYATQIPADNKRICLMQDRQYRLGAADGGVGYPYNPQLSYSLEKVTDKQ